MNQFNVGDKVWYKYEDLERVFKIVEIKGNVAILKNDAIDDLKEAYFDEIKMFKPCTNKTSIGRPTCKIR